MDPFGTDSEPEEPDLEDGLQPDVQAKDCVILGLNVLNRDNFNTEQTEAGLASLGVAAYSANTLETGFINQAEEAFEEVQASRKNKQISLPVHDALGSLQAVKVGDLTPFDIPKPTTSVYKTKSEGRAKIPSSVPTPCDIPSTSKAHPVERCVVDDDAYEPSDVEYSTDSELGDNFLERKPVKTKRTTRKSRKPTVDDGNEADFVDRIRCVTFNYHNFIRRAYHDNQLNLQRLGQENDLDANLHEILESYRVNERIWNRLYKYQKTGVRWLLQLHGQMVGGILADEMGLGKTVQVAVFLRAISESRNVCKVFGQVTRRFYYLSRYKGLGPSLIVAPATLMHQWVKELNIWFPKCRVVVLHSSSSFSGNKAKLFHVVETPRPNGTVLVTSYSTFTIEYKKLIKVRWHYAILDEGHKIRNPDTKELRTPHRLLLSGSPMQNNLKELWSLIDFVYPGRLGALKEFNERFAIPITQGGFASANPIQVRTAFKCACILRDAINPYMLRRMKNDVEMTINLPNKTEQVLFCEITEDQRDLYKEFIASRECRHILAGKVHPFAGLITLRKLCNHPDLITGGPNRYHDKNLDEHPELEFGHCQRSGKLVVTQALLKLWKEQGHKVLLFSQSKQMLTLLEKLVLTEGYNYLRMDGGTPIARRQPMVMQFNETPDMFVFLLTTRVGGLGLNLTGADRVLIFDPDWNPSTDAQARERAWRIGQDKPVTIYRLMTSGTIEEKIYQRQIFKQFLANKVLLDPKQRRFFKMNDLMELFQLGDVESDRKHGTETAALFHGQARETNKKNFFNERAKLKKKTQERKQQHADDEEEFSDFEVDVQLTDDYKRKLWERAQMVLEKNHEMLPSTSTSTPENHTPKLYRYDELDENLRRRIDKLPEDHPLKKRVIRENCDEMEKRTEESGRKEKLKKGEKKLLDGKFEIRYLKKQKTYKEKKDKQKEKQKTKDQDDFVLAHLLKNTGVHSALQHDQVVGENSNNADVQLIEDEAENVAKRAAEVLKMSRKRHDQFVRHACAGTAVSKPSIFGRKRALVADDEDAKQSIVISSGRDESDHEDNQLPDMFNGGLKRVGPVMSKKHKPDATLSSAELFSEIKQRRVDHLEDVVPIRHQDEDEQEESTYPSLAARQKKPDVALNDKYEQLGDDIRMFFVSNNGPVTTTQLLEKFKKKVPPQDTFVFRSILRKLAIRLPNSHWALRQDFA